MQKSYYLILGVSSDASAEEIRTAFHRRAQELHPDHSGLDAGPFIELQQAYQVLSDPGRRVEYDRQNSRSDLARSALDSRPEPLVPNRAEPLQAAALARCMQRPTRPRLRDLPLAE